MMTVRTNAGGMMSTTTRRFVHVLLAVVALAILGRASASSADAACTADPPGAAAPEHHSRTLELHVGGWDCVLSRDGAEVATVHIGWWADDPAAPWGDFEDTTG